MCFFGSFFEICETLIDRSDVESDSRFLDEGAEYECVRGVVVVFYGSGSSKNLTYYVKTIRDSPIKKYI